jgi:hypothetical protein
MAKTRIGILPAAATARAQIIKTITYRSSEDDIR